jgi:hypothetical protein
LQLGRKLQPQLRVECRRELPEYFPGLVPPAGRNERRCRQLRAGRFEGRDSHQSATQRDRVGGSSQRGRGGCRVGEDLCDAGSQPRALLLDPHVEWRLAQRCILEKIASCDFQRSLELAGADEGLELVEVDGQAIGRYQAKALPVLRQDIVPDGAAKPMQRLPERIPRFVLIDSPPEQVDDFVPSDLAPDGQEAEECQRLAPPQPGRNSSRVVPEGRRPEEAQLEGSDWTPTRCYFATTYRVVTPVD